jgi:hypothetical protein
MTPTNRLKSVAIVAIVIAIVALFQRVNEQEEVLRSFMRLTTEQFDNLHERDILMLRIIKQQNGAEYKERLS